MKLEIQPYVGVGQIKFGMTVDEVRKSVGFPVKPFFKGPNADFPTDSFNDLGIHVYYKKPGICEAVEMFLAADPMFQGHRFIERPFDEILGWLRTLDDSVVLDETGLTAFKLGIAVYAPDISETMSAPVEAVLAFENGYYD